VVTPIDDRNRMAERFPCPLRTGGMSTDSIRGNSPNLAISEADDYLVDERRGYSIPRSLCVVSGSSTGGIFGGTRGNSKRDPQKLKAGDYQHTSPNMRQFHSIPTSKKLDSSDHNKNPQNSDSHFTTLTNLVLQKAKRACKRAFFRALQTAEARLSVLRKKKHFVHLKKSILFEVIEDPHGDPVNNRAMLKNRLRDLVLPRDATPETQSLAKLGLNRVVYLNGEQNPNGLNSSAFASRTRNRSSAVSDGNPKLTADEDIQTTFQFDESEANFITKLLLPFEVKYSDENRREEVDLRDGFGAWRDNVFVEGMNNGVSKNTANCDSSLFKNSRTPAAPREKTKTVHLSLTAFQLPNALRIQGFEVERGVREKLNRVELIGIDR
jgi:hypothetical protein